MSTTKPQRMIKNQFTKCVAGNIKGCHEITVSKVGYAVRTIDTPLKVRTAYPTWLSTLCTSRPKPVISAGMPKTRPWTVTSRLCKCLIQLTCQSVVSCSRLRGHRSWPPVCHPWTLDFGIHAEMTAFLLVPKLELGNH